MSAAIRVTAPGTLSNLGPGFDVLGLALTSPEDAVEVALGRSDLELRATGPFGDRVPLDPEQNVAAFAARRVREALGRAEGLVVTVEKHIPPGSGLGSSAASAVAAAVATQRALGASLPVERLLAIGRDAEALAAGSAHLDNVAPALLGGFVAVTSLDPPCAIRLPFPPTWWFAVILPDHPVRTADARAALPDAVAMGDAVANLRAMAALWDAIARVDLDAFAAALRDRLAEPHRLRLWPFLAAARRSALAVGARSLVVSGSGPALFAPCATRAEAHDVAEAAREGLAREGYEARTYLASPRAEGALG